MKVIAVVPQLKRNQILEDVEYLDEDIEAVQGIFKTISNSINASKGAWQGIVLDHAGDNIYGEIPGVYEVEVWRDGDKLIPDIWQSL